MPFFLSNFTIEAALKNRFEAAYIGGLVQSGGRILEAVPPRKTTIGGYKALLISHKVIANGMAGDISLYMIEKADGVQLITFTCADSDVKYWKAVKESILASVR